LSPGEITSSSELNSLILTRIFPCPSEQADHSLSSQSCESYPQSAHVSEDGESADDATASITETESDSEEPQPLSLKLSNKNNTKTEVLEKSLELLEPKSSTTETESNRTLEEEESTFRKIGRFIQDLYAQHKDCFFNPTEIFNRSNADIEDPQAEKSTVAYQSKLQTFKAKVIALGNRRRNPERMNRPSRRIEFGIKVVLNSSPVRNSRAKTILKRLRESQKALEDDNISSSSLSINEIDSTPRKFTDYNQRRYDCAGSSYQNYQELRIQNNGGAFTKFMHEMFIQQPSYEELDLKI